jgi:hypothetical protein
VQSWGAVPGTICAPPCDSKGGCCGSYQRDHRFQTALPILAKPQCVLTDAGAPSPSPPNEPKAKCRGSMCVLTCDPTTQLKCGTGKDHRPLDPGFNNSCPCILNGKCWIPPGCHLPDNCIPPTNCQMDQTCISVPQAGFEPKGICVWNTAIHDDWHDANGKRFPNHPTPDSLPVNGWSTAHLLCDANASSSGGNITGTCFACAPPPPPPPPPPPQLRYMCDTVNNNCFPTPLGYASPPLPSPATVAGSALWLARAWAPALQSRSVPTYP